MNVAIIDYKMSNLHSVQAACKKVGLSSVITSDKGEILDAKIAILPGVGAFGEAMNHLAKSKLDDCIYKFIESGRPFIGICLGLQMLFDESEEFDVLDNEELHVDFQPLFECLHIHEALGQSDKFRAEYAATRRRQKELLLPSFVDLMEEDEQSLSSLLEGIAGFAIIERATMRRAHNLRSPVDVRIPNGGPLIKF